MNARAYTKHICFGGPRDHQLVSVADNEHVFVTPDVQHDPATKWPPRYDDIQAAVTTHTYRRAFIRDKAGRVYTLFVHEHLSFEEVAPAAIRYFGINL
jgi:hypothetical protein